MTSRRPAPTSWRTTLAALLAALAFFVGWGGIMHSRSVPRFEQLAPGAAGRQGPVTMALTSLTTRTSFDDITGDQPALPAGAVFVVASLRTMVTTPETVYCPVFLIDRLGHRWSPIDVNHEAVTSCYRVEPNTLTAMELVFVVPRSAVPDITGVTMNPERGVSRTPVLRPPA